MSGFVDSKLIVKKIVFRKTNKIRGRLLIQGGDYISIYLYIYIYVYFYFYFYFYIYIYIYPSLSI